MIMIMIMMIMIFIVVVVVVVVVVVIIIIIVNLKYIRNLMYSLYLRSVTGSETVGHALLVQIRHATKYYFKRVETHFHKRRINGFFPRGPNFPIDVLCHVFTNVSFYVVAAAIKNPCAAVNGGCLGLCLLKPKGHSCSCPNGLHLVTTGNVTRCQGMDKLVVSSDLIRHMQKHGATRCILGRWTCRPPIYCVCMGI